MNIIPSINCREGDFACVKQKVHTAETFATWVHVDVADGIFTFNKSWNDSEEWPSLATKLNLEVHLMVEHPEDMLDGWIGARAKRIIFHLEAVHAAHDGKPEKAIADIVRRCAEKNVEAMLATNHETPIEALEPYLSMFGAFQVLAVFPGPAGQRFLPMVLPKISFLRSRVPDATIEVDGGMIPETVRQVKEAGADTVVAGSYTLEGGDPAAAYKELVTL